MRAMTRITVLGGCGAVGSIAVRTLKELPDFNEIIIADINTEAAQNLAAELGGECTAMEVNALNAGSIQSAIKGSEVVLNCVGPFYKFGLPILKAVIKSGINYVDICDDYDMTEELLDSFDKDAKDAGTTCIVGLGASPGLTNIMAKFASEQLTKTKDITVCVTRGLTEEAGGAIPYHMFHCWLGPVPVYKNGQFTKGMGLTDGGEPIIFIGRADRLYDGIAHASAIKRMWVSYDNGLTSAVIV